MREPGADRVLAFGEHELDFGRSELRCGGALAEIRPTPLRVLLYLAEHRDRTVPRAELLEALWPGVVVSDEALSTALKEARQAVGDGGAEQRVIRTLKGVGYRFVADATLVTEARTTSDASEAQPNTAERRDTKGVRPRAVSRRRFALAAVAAAAFALALWLGVRDAPEAPTPEAVRFGIAVLPVASLSERASDRELADGLTEQITHVLSQNPYPVVARTTAAQWRDRAADVRALGRELGVSHVLEGSVRRGGERVRVTMQLVATDTGLHVWSETFDANAGDPLATQDRVSARVAVQVYKFVWEDATAMKRDPRLAELSKLVVEDRRSFAEGRWEDNLAIVERLLARTPEREPFLGLRGYAHASISHALANLHQMGERSFAEAGPDLLAHAERGVALAPNDPHSHMVLGRAYAQSWRWAEAEREMERTCEIAPREWACAGLRANLCAAFGCVEAQLAAARRAADAFPNPNFWAVLSNALACSGQLEEAEAASVRAMEGGGPALGALLPHIRWQRGQRADAVRTLGELLAAVGAVDAAREVERRGAESPEAAWRWYAEQSAASAASGRALPPHYLAALHFAELGEADAALTSLEHSIAAHESGFELIGFNPAFDPLRDTRRFQALIEKMGLAPYHAEYRPRRAR